MMRGVLACVCLISAATIAHAQQRPDVSGNWMLNGGTTTFGEWHLTEAKWINPHSRFRIDVKQDDGLTVEWLVEMGAVNTMRRAGFEIEKFVVGDTLTIVGWPGRDRNRTMLLRTAVLKDGRRLTP
jgi:hypothetical protein